MSCFVFVLFCFLLRRERKRERERESKYHLKWVIICPSAKRHFLAFRWRADDGPTVNAGLVSLWFFRGSRPILLGNPIFCDCSGGPDPLSPLWIRACLSSWIGQYVHLNEVVAQVPKSLELAHIPLYNVFSNSLLSNSSLYRSWCFVNKRVLVGPWFM